MTKTDSRARRTWTKVALAGLAAAVILVAPGCQTAPPQEIIDALGGSEEIARELRDVLVPLLLGPDDLAVVADGLQPEWVSVNIDFVAVIAAKGEPDIAAMTKRDRLVWIMVLVENAERAGSLKFWAIGEWKPETTSSP